MYYLANSSHEQFISTATDILINQIASGIYYEVVMETDPCVNYSDYSLQDLHETICHLSDSQRLSSDYDLLELAASYSPARDSLTHEVLIQLLEDTPFLFFEQIKQSMVEGESEVCSILDAIERLLAKNITFNDVSCQYRPKTSGPWVQSEVYIYSTNVQYRNLQASMNYCINCYTDYPPSYNTELAGNWNTLKHPHHFEKSKLSLISLYAIPYFKRQHFQAEAA